MDVGFIYLKPNELNINQFSPRDSFRIFYLDGSHIKNRERFFNEISTLFSFPEHVRGFDAYLDWIRDLSWISEENIALVINQYQKLLRGDIEGMRIFWETLVTTVFPWWKYDVINHVVGGKPRKFHVYLIE